MNKLSTLTLIAIVIAAFAATFTPARNVEAKAPISSAYYVNLPSDDETPTGPVFLGTAHSNGSKASMFVPTAEVRKVKHSNKSAANVSVAVNTVTTNTVTTFEDGSWIDNSTGNTGCNADGICNLNDDGATIFEDGSWLMPDGTTGCLPWGICTIGH